MADTIDYSKSYAGDDQKVKTTCIILKDSNGDDVELCGDDLQALLALLVS